MASITVDPQRSTPAHEWAANTMDALQGSKDSSSPAQGSAQQTLVPSVTSTQGTGPDSQVSTPGVEFPGAFPREARSEAQAISTRTHERTPQAAVSHLADAAPPKTVSDVQETAKSYLPNVNVQRAIDTAASYLPESVVGAVGSVLPVGVTNTNQVEKSLDPISGAKPTSDASATSNVTNLDNASTTAIPPSTPVGSMTSGASAGEATPAVEKDAEIGNALDGTSPAKPAVGTTETSKNTEASDSVPYATHTQGASTQVASSPVNSGNMAVAMHTLPTPPTSKGSLPLAGPDTTRPPGLEGSTQGDPLRNLEEPTNDVSTSPTSGVGSKESTDGLKKASYTPTPSPKDDDVPSSQQSHQDTPQKSSTASQSQPTVNPTPTQSHVKSGTAVGSLGHGHLPGTSPAGGSGIDPSISPKSEISHPHIPEDAKIEKSTEVKAGSGNGNGASGASSSDDNFGGNGNGKKESGLKKVVHKVKDKLSHKNH